MGMGDGGWTVSLGLGLLGVRIGRLWVLRTDGQTRMVD